MRRKFPLVIFGTNVKNSGVCRLFAGCLQGICRLFAGCLQVVCRVFAGSLQGVCMLFPASGFIIFPASCRGADKSLA